MTAQKPEALRLADWLDDQYDPDHHKADAAAELRRLHARIAELEAQLESIGAGGVEPLRRDHFRDATGMRVGWNERLEHD